VVTTALVVVGAVVLGGEGSPTGPLLGASAFTWLSDVLARFTEYWRACVGVAVLLIVSAFPNGIGGALPGLRFRARAAR